MSGEDEAAVEETEQNRAIAVFIKDNKEAI